MTVDANFIGIAVGVTLAARTLDALTAVADLAVYTGITAAAAVVGIGTGVGTGIIAQYLSGATRRAVVVDAQSLVTGLVRRAVAVVDAGTDALTTVADLAVVAVVV